MSLCEIILYLLYPKAQSESHLLFVLYALV